MNDLDQTERTVSSPAVEPVRVRRALVPILLALTLSLVTIGALVLFAAVTLDRQNRATTLQMVETGLVVEADRLAQLARDYSWWDEAIRNLVLTLDPEWADDNIGSYLHDAFDLDLSLVLDRNERIVIAYVDGQEAHPQARDLLDSGARPMVKAARQAAASSPMAVTGYLMFRDRPYLVAMSAFVDEDGPRGPPDGAVLLLGQRLDTGLVAKLGALFRIEGLGLVRAHTATAEPRILLEDPRGIAIAALVWPESTQARSLLVMLPPLGAVVVVVVLLTWRFLAVELAERRHNQMLLTRLATTDALTGISNRHAFLGQARREVLRSQRFGHELAVLMLDIDHFKSVNDGYGHAAGDAVLQSLAGRVGEHLRSVDLFGRLGGEEFAVLLPETPLDAAVETAERLRVLVAAQEVETTAVRLTLTLSIGVAGLATGETDVGAPLARADQALYRAKTSGRNRVELWYSG